MAENFQFFIWFILHASFFDLVSIFVRFLHVGIQPIVVMIVCFWVVLGIIEKIIYSTCIACFGMTAIAAGSHPVPFRTRQ